MERVQSALQSNSTVFTVPNIITISRLFLMIPMCALAFPFKGKEYGTFLLISGVLVILGDIVDGIVARKLQQTTPLGTVLDQFADSVSLVLVLIFGVYIEEISVVFCLLYLIRELWVYAIRQHAAMSNISIASSRIGKSASTVLSVALLFCLLPVFGNISSSYQQPIYILSRSILCVGLGMTWFAALSYTKQFITKCILGIQRGAKGQ